MPLLRAANNGISGVVDARGHVVDALALNARGIIDAHVPIVRERLLSASQRLLDSYLIIALFGVLALFFTARRGRRTN